MGSKNVDRRGVSGRPSANTGAIEELKQLFQHNPSASNWTVHMQLGVLLSTVHQILRERVSFFSYNLQNVQYINEVGKEKQLYFAEHCSPQLEGYSEFISRIFLSAGFRCKIVGVVNKKSVSISVGKTSVETLPDGFE